MPAIKWIIEPAYPCRRQLPPDKHDVYEFDAITNSALTACIKQLASVASAAGHLFDELTADLIDVHERTRSLSTRVVTIQQVVDKLDAKKLKIRKLLTSYVMRRLFTHSSKTLN